VDPEFVPRQAHPSPLRGIADPSVVGDRLLPLVPIEVSQGMDGQSHLSEPIWNGHPTDASIHEDPGVVQAASGIGV